MKLKLSELKLPEEILGMPALGFSIIVAFITALILFFTIDTVSVDPGEEAVLIDRPFFFGHEGVRDEVLTEGRIFTWATTKAIKQSVVPVSFPVALDDFSTSDNVLLDFQTSIQLRNTNSKVLVTKFGDKWFENNVKPQFLTLVRDAVKKRTMSQIMSDPVTSKQIDDEVTSGLVQLVKTNRIPVLVINVALGRAKPNQVVLDQINETATQQQRNITLIAATQAEKSRKAEQEAKAEADSAYRDKLHLSTTEFIRLQEATIMANACKEAKACVMTSHPNQSVLVNTGK